MKTCGATLDGLTQTPWNETELVDLVSGAETTKVTTASDGKATLGAPKQGYRIYAPTNILSQVGN